MPFELTKQTLAAIWVFAAAVVGLAAGVGSIGQLILLETVAVGPPLMMFVLWKRPVLGAGRILDSRR